MLWSALGRAWWGGTREEGSASLEEEEDAYEEWLRGKLRSSSDMILGREEKLTLDFALGVHRYLQWGCNSVCTFFLDALSSGTL